MIRMVNLTCPKCGMSLDLDVDAIESYCPNCGGKLFITVSQAIDVWNEKKMIKRKDIKYATKVSEVNDTKRDSKSFPFEIIGIVFVVLLIFYALYLWYINANI